MGYNRPSIQIEFKRKDHFLYSFSNFLTNFYLYHCRDYFFSKRRILFIFFIFYVFKLLVILIFNRHFFIYYHKNLIVFYDDFHYGDDISWRTLASDDFPAYAATSVKRTFVFRVALIGGS